MQSMDRAEMATDEASGAPNAFTFREFYPNTGEQYQPFMMNLEGGILNCNQPMPNNTEVKLSFDRNLASIGLLYREAPGGGRTVPTELNNKTLELHDPYLEI